MTPFIKSFRRSGVDERSRRRRLRNPSPKGAWPPACKTPESAWSRRFKPARSVLAWGSAFMMIVLDAGVQADRFYLEEGGVIEGRLVEERDNLILLATLSGELQIPRSIVSHVVKETSRRELYEQRVQAQPLTALRHAELAAWLQEQQCLPTARRHLIEALKEAPSLAEARYLAGYVSVGDVWLKADARWGNLNEPVDPDDSSSWIDGRLSARQERLARQISIGWYRRVGAIREAFFESNVPAGRKTPEEGRTQLLKITSPWAIEPACAALGDGDAATRLALVDFLSLFEQDEAVLNLFILALVDPADEVHRQAVFGLKRRQDPRVVALTRVALRGRSENVVDRAARALGEFGDKSAFTDLVEALSTDGFPQERLSLREIADQARKTLSGSTRIPIDDRHVVKSPLVSLPDFPRLATRIDEAPPAPAGRNRTAVQDALVVITGENHGFEKQAWLNWLARNPPLPAPPP